VVTRERGVPAHAPAACPHTRRRPVSRFFVRRAARTSGSAESEIDTAAHAPHSSWFMRTMLKRFALVGSALILALGSLSWSSRAAAQEPITVRGEILDLTCYLSKGSKGARHKTCAKMCAEKGLPMGILTESGDVFLLIEDHDDPDPYDALKKLAGRDAEVSGKRYEKDGLRSILVQGSKGL
jgi:hypothetical protein